MNPVTQEVLARVPPATTGEVDAAIRSVHTALATWKNTPVGACMRIMLKFQVLTHEHSSCIVHTLTTEQGEALPDAENDIFRGLEVAEHACSVGSLQQGEFLGNMAGAVDTHTLCQPTGVCAGITPFNLPATIPLRMFSTAIVCGNTFMLKPSEQDPSSTMQLVELALEAGVSPGILDIVYGSKDVMDVSCTHEYMKAISFVGLTAVSTHVCRLGSEHDKRMQSIMGARDRVVVLSNANREQATNVLVGAAFGAMGQRCMATSVVVPVGAAQQWVPDLIVKVKALKVNVDVEPGTDVDPIVSCVAKQRVFGLIGSGAQQGVTLAPDGRSVYVTGYEGGSLIGPTVFADVKTDMDTCTNEIFGPVLLALTVPALDNAIALVNVSPLGNGVGLFTQNDASARKFQSEIDVEQVGINIPIPVPVPYFSFVGSRDSKLGDLGPYGKQVVQFYTQMKVIAARWFNGAVNIDDVNTATSLC